MTLIAAKGNIRTGLLIFPVIDIQMPVAMNFLTTICGMYEHGCNKVKTAQCCCDYSPRMRHIWIKT
ncbi:CLUMA_CG020728, isoform A [Clunio marinus]|uniref:CLUMA_CG020728, isoform A n=1 Tax=Clunio marinus TaxID=568069 RepID=A0A1J1J8I5_9DIPT|nr:CLUMA_CG020728, isoform A [Clunio marinus]